MSLSKKQREVARELAIKEAQQKAHARATASETEAKRASALLVAQQKRVSPTIAVRGKLLSALANKCLSCSAGQMIASQNLTRLFPILEKKAANILRCVPIALGAQANWHENRVNRNEDHTYENAIGYLCHMLWLRDVKDWHPEGKSPETRMRSLIQWLIGKYTIPKFLFGIFSKDQEAYTFFPLLVRLIQGGSMKAARKNGLLRANMTQKMDHLFLTAPAESTVMGAIRRAQILALGGTPRLVTAVMGTFLREVDSLAQDDFWITVIQWLCSQAMMDYSQVGPLLDYVRHQQGNNPAFSMKGRTAVSLLRDVHQWHTEVNARKAAKNKDYPPSHYKDWSSFVEGDDQDKDVWTVTEVLTTKELHAEGKELRHCVVSYESSILRGDISIWSLRKNGDRMLTIEINNRTRRVVQVRGFCNRQAKPQETHRIQVWARLNGLTMSDFL